MPIERTETVTAKGGVSVFVSLGMLIVVVRDLLAQYPGERNRLSMASAATADHLFALSGLFRAVMDELQPIITQTSASRPDVEQQPLPVPLSEINHWPLSPITRFLVDQLVDSAKLTSDESFYAVYECASRFRETLFSLGLRRTVSSEMVRQIAAFLGSTVENILNS